MNFDQLVVQPQHLMKQTLTLLSLTSQFTKAHSTIIGRSLVADETLLSQKRITTGLCCLLLIISYP